MFHELHESIQEHCLNTFDEMWSQESFEIVRAIFRIPQHFSVQQSFVHRYFIFYLISQPHSPPSKALQLDGWIFNLAFTCMVSLGSGATSRAILLRGSREDKTTLCRHEQWQDYQRPRHGTVRQDYHLYQQSVQLGNCRQAAHAP